MTLSDLPDGLPARVVAVTGDALLRERLVELGFTAGERVEVASRALFAGPLRVRLRRGSLAVRRDEAQNVQVTTDPVPAGFATAASMAESCR